MGITLVEPEAVKTVALETLIEAGVEVLFYTFFSSVLMDATRSKAVARQTKVDCAIW